MNNSFPQSLKCHVSKKLAALVTSLTLSWVIVPALLAQDINPQPLQQRGGLQVRTVSGYTGYYSKTLPNGGVIQPGVAALPGDVSMGGSVTFAWTKFTERSTFFLDYIPSYTGRVQYSSGNALNHSLALNATRKLAPRWTFGFTVAGDLSSIEQSLFAPTTLSNVVSVRATFDDLAAGILSSKFANNPQLASVLTTAPLVESPVRNLLYGQRMFTSSVQTSLSYSYSPRLSFTFAGGAGRSQHVSNDQPLGMQNTYLLPNTTSANANVTISYSLSPLTQLGGSVTTNRISSFMQDAYTTTSLASLGRTLGRRWLLQIHGGVGVTNPVRQTAIVFSTRPNPIVGGSLGFKTFSQTLVGSYDRTVVDSYGIGASTTSSAAASWRWGRPGSAWWLESSATWQELQGNFLANTSGWQTSVGFGRSIGTHLAVLTKCAYLDYSGQLQKSPYSLSQSAVRVSLVWTPNPGPVK